MKNTEGIDLKIYSEFDEQLVNEWNKLFISLKGTYNLSPEWCSIWFKHFGGKDQKPFICTYWEDNELKLVAPFYLRNNVLCLIGSNPDFYDEFNILSTSDNYSEKLVEDILDKELKVDFRLVNSESKFVKTFLKKLEAKRTFNKKIYFSTLKFHADSNFKFGKSFAYRIKRKITSSNNKFNKKLNFEFESKKSPENFEEMLTLHKKKWSLFKSKEKELFLRDLYFNTDLLFLSKLSHEGAENAVSYQLSYKYFDKISIMASAFDPSFEVISPSLLIHYHFFDEGFKRNYSLIDFGVGAYSYKYNFTNSEAVIFSIKTEKSFIKKYDFIYCPLKNLKSKFESVLKL